MTGSAPGSWGRPHPRLSGLPSREPEASGAEQKTMSGGNARRITSWAGQGQLHSGKAERCPCPVHCTTHFLAKSTSFLRPRARYQSLIEPLVSTDHAVLGEASAAGVLGLPAQPPAKEGLAGQEQDPTGQVFGTGGPGQEGP